MKSILDKDNSVYFHSLMSLVYKILGMILSLMSASLLLTCLGDYKYGIWVSVLSMVSWVYSMDLGIGNGLRNKLAESIALNKMENGRKYVAVSYLNVALISLFIFGVVFIVMKSCNIATLLNINIKDESIDNIILAAVSLACVNFVLSLCNNVSYAVQKASWVSGFSIIGQVIYVLFIILFIYTKKRCLLYIALAEGIAQVVKNVVFSIYLVHRYPEFKFSYKDIDIKYSKGILSLGIQMFLIQISALILNSTDNILITKLFDPSYVTPYSFCYKFFGIFNTIFFTILNPFVSAYTDKYVKGQIENVKNMMRKTMYVYIIFALCCLISIFLFKPIAFIWLHKSLNYDKNLIGFTAIYFICLMFTHLFSTFLTGIGRTKELMIVVCLQSVLNIPLSVFCADSLNMGTTGVIFGSIICMVLGVLVYPIKTYHILKNKSNG